MATMRNKQADLVFVAEKAHADKVSCLDIGQTGGVLVTGGHDRNVNLWAFGNDKCFMTLRGHNRPVECVKFAHQDNFVYSADDIGIIKEWDMNAGTDERSANTYHGHMKSVKTLDFHPVSPCFVSGSNDTTIRLWDMKRTSECLAKYRAHITNVNQVQFSPDGLWIASAGAEGSVLIWEVRMSLQIMEFHDSTAAVSCIQFHPSDLLLAAGRTDGSVDIFDLEAKRRLTRLNINAGTVRCCTFGESGDRLYVGTDNGVAVVGWEPDREIAFFQSSWKLLLDMKLMNDERLMCASTHQTGVQVNGISVHRDMGTLGQLVQQPPFSLNQRIRKSFERKPPTKNVALRYDQPYNDGTDDNMAEDESSTSPSSLSIEMMTPLATTVTPIPNDNLTAGRTNVNDDDSDTLEFPYPDEPRSRFDLMTAKGPWRSNDYADDTGHNSLSLASSVSPSYEPSSETHISGQSLMPNIVTGRGRGEYPDSEYGPPSLDLNRIKTDDFMNDKNIGHNNINPFADLGYRSDTGCSNDPEDFPVNNAPPVSYPIKRKTESATSHNNAKNNVKTPPIVRIEGRQKTSIGFSSRYSTSTMNIASTGGMPNKLKHATSVTNISELAQSNTRGRTTLSRNQQQTQTKSRIPPKGMASKARMSNVNDYNSNLNKENRLQGNNGGKSTNPMRVEIYMTPSQRSRSSLDIRTAKLGDEDLTLIAPTARPRVHRSPISNNNMNNLNYHHNNHNNNGSSNNHNNYLSNHHANHTNGNGVDLPKESFISHTNERREIKLREAGTSSAESSILQHIINGHDAVFQELCTRHASLKMNKQVAVTQDILLAIQQISRVKDHGVMVDVLGAILENSASFTLDLALVLLPELYELLQSERKFHCTRACDTLRVILTNFLPLIKENSSSWAAYSLGVDISSESRYKKCAECRKWLLMIRTIPENKNISTALSQLQNLIVDI